MNVPASIDLTEAERATTAEWGASGKRKRVAHWMAAVGKGMATLGAILLALLPPLDKVFHRSPMTSNWYARAEASIVSARPTASWTNTSSRIVFGVSRRPPSV